VQLDFQEVAAIPFRDRSHRVPVLGFGREAAAILVVARVEIVRRLCHIVVQSVLLVAVGRHAQQRLVLEDEIRQAVEDRLALVDLDAAQHVRAMADEHVGAGVDYRARKHGDEVGGNGSIGAALVAMQRDNHDVGQRGSAADHARDRFDVLLEGLGPRTRLRSNHVAAAAKVQGVAAAGWGPRQLRGHAPQIRHALGGDHIRRVEAERVQSRPRRHVAAGVAGARMRRERRRGGDQRDPRFRRFKELGFARFGQAVADAGLDETGFADVLAGHGRTGRTEITGVIVGARDEIESGPHQLLDDRRLGAHPRAAAFVRRRHFVVVEQGLEIGEGGIRAADHVEQAGELRLFEHLKPLVDDRIARQGQGEGLTGLRTLTNAFCACQRCPDNQEDSDSLSHCAGSGCGSIA